MGLYLNNLEQHLILAVVCYVSYYSSKTIAEKVKQCITMSANCAIPINL